MKLEKDNKKFDLRNHYKKSWNFIKDSKKFIFFSIGAFFFFLFIGFFVPTPESISNKIFEYMHQILAQTEGLSGLGLVWFIFLNNLKSSFFGMVSGFAFGIVPFFALIANGYVVGFVSAMSVNSVGWGSLLNLLPHGIFELPAIFISLSLGLRFGTFIFQKNQSESFRKYLWESLRVFGLIVLPLLIIAAIIEGLLIFYF